MLRQSMLGLKGIESGEGGPTPQDIEEVRALAVVNLTDCVCLLDLYLSGSVVRREQKADLKLAHDLIHDGVDWRVSLSDDQSTLVLSKQEPFVDLDLSKVHTERARTNWRKIDVEETKVPLVMEDPEGWKRELVRALTNQEGQG